MLSRKKREWKILERYFLDNSHGMSKYMWSKAQYIKCIFFVCAIIFMCFLLRNSEILRLLHSVYHPGYVQMVQRCSWGRRDSSITLYRRESNVAFWGLSPYFEALPWKISAHPWSDICIQHIPLSCNIHFYKLYACSQDDMNYLHYRMKDKPT